ncbi:glycerophosphodiester phosphodiesterase [Sporomusa sphaeroides DSM 2875]|uniref:glycerophosphodiester phosphodiesterase n=1 Tax=Sporomusa sphaeroides TaxID=47679 RepID=UPI00202E97EC|nr:glycerophosphodiester phosphodiesterase [Sporomusa sphaeroides]MCM0759005.1 glycerophosphodiester phosphodiesterase [Sporomusa sphaeroides DSM 2875]
MLIYAHRGARGYAPENTMAAFRQALACKADGIELDVQLTKDRQLVICHDHSIDRTSNGSGWIKNFTLAELKALDFGSWFAPAFAGEPIPTLEEFCRWYVTTPLLLNIEIKNGPVVYKGIEEQIIYLLKRICPKDFDMYNRVIISSFYHPSLVKIKQIDNRFKTGVLFADHPVNVLSLIKQTNADYLHPHWHYLNRNWIEAAHEAGIGVNSYTINTQEEFDFSCAQNIDGLFSDYPDRFTGSRIP